MTAITKHEAAARVNHVVLYARTLRDVTMIDTVYVVASGTHRGRIELAAITTALDVKVLAGSLDPFR